MIQSFKYGIFFLLIGLLFSCSRHVTETQLEKLPKVKDTQLNHILDSLATVKFEQFYSKISKKVQDSTQNVS